MSDRLHPREIVGYEGRVGELATEVGRLTYDQVSEFLGSLGAELARQAKGDRGRGRGKLAGELDDASKAIEEARRYVEAAWEICLPYMRPEELGEDGNENT